MEAQNMVADAEYQKGRISIFDLKEGKEYLGYTRGSKTSRKFKIINGTLHNNDTIGGAFTTVCTYVPSDSTFDEVIVDHPKKGSKAPIFALEEGMYYRDGGNYYGRKNNKFVTTDEAGVAHPEQRVKILGLTTLYICVGEMQ